MAKRRSVQADWGDEQVYLLELTAADAREVFGTAVPAAGGPGAADDVVTQVGKMAGIVVAGVYRDEQAGARRFTSTQEALDQLPMRLLASTAAEILRLSGLDVEVQAAASAFPGDKGGNA